MAQLEIKGQELICEIGGKVRDDVRVLRVHRSVGGQRMLEAICQFTIADSAPKKVRARGDLLHDLSLRNDFPNGDAVRIFQTVKGQRELIHWGHVLEVNPVLSEQEVAYRFRSGVTPQHFLIPLRGPSFRLRLPSGRTTQAFYDEPVWFNPEDEGVVWPNRSKWTFDKNAYYWADVRAARSPAARRWQQEPEPPDYLGWELAQAVHTLCWQLNYDETWIANPAGSPKDLETRVFGKIPLKNVQVPRFRYLPEILDGLLAPYGFGWYLEFFNDRPRIAFYAIGQGIRSAHGATPIKFSHQRAKQPLDLAKTNVESCDLHFRLDGNLVNHLAVISHPVQIEATFELVRAWKPGYDTLDRYTDLMLGHSNYEENPDYHRVWRDWVLNEAGDYVGLRPQITKPFDFSQLFRTKLKIDGKEEDAADYFGVRRRKFQPTLTLDPDGKAAGPMFGVLVEYKDVDGPWKPLEDMDDEGHIPPFALLDDECGIRFTGLKVPQPLYEAGSQARIRVTATIEADAGVLGIRGGAGKPSVNRSYRSTAILDGRDRYKVRLIDESSTYYQREGNTLQVNELKPMTNFLDQQYDRWNRADCNGPITLAGLGHGGLELGAEVSRIYDRDVFLQTHHQLQRFPQIIALDYDPIQQQTIVQLDSPREDVIL